MRKTELSPEEMQKVLGFPKCYVDGNVSKMAHIDICSAEKKLGGIYVTVYPISANKVKEAHEVRQKIIMNPMIQKEVVNSAKSKKRKKKKKRYSPEKYFSGHSVARA